MRFLIKLYNENNMLKEPYWVRAKAEVTKKLVPQKVSPEVYESQFHSSVVYFFTYDKSYESQLLKMAEQLADKYAIRIVVATLNVKENK